MTALAGCSGSDGESTTDGSTTDGTTDASSTSSGEATTTTTDEETSQSEKTADVSVGSVVEDDSLAMVVRDVERKEKLSEYQQADSGNTYVVVTMAVKNKSDEFVDFNSFWQTRVKDGSDHVYDQTITGSGSAMTSGQLAPGEVSRGDVFFEVPKDAADLTLQFDFSSFQLFSFSRVTVNLGEQADSVADLEQALQVEVHSVGDAVSKHDLKVVVNDVRTAEKLGQFTEADDGNDVIPDISVTNDTGEALSVSISLQMLVKDDTGQAYTLDIGGYSALDQKFAQGSSSGGDTAAANWPTRSRTDAGELLFAFELDLVASGDKTFWSLDG